MTAPTLDEMIEAVEWEAHGVLIGLASHIDQELAKLHEIRLRAAAETLRRVKSCRARAEQQIADGVTVAADIEGLVP